MDPLTHALTGAVLVRALPAPDTGRRGMLFGMVVAAAPDLDFVPAFVAALPGNLIPGSRLFDPRWELLHRGQTHSLFFAILVGAAAGWAFCRFGGGKGSPFVWSAVGALLLLSHVLLDLVNNGAALWLPFSDAWVWLGDLPVVDPFTLGPLLIWFFVSRSWRLLRRGEETADAQRVRKLSVCCLLFIVAAVSARLVIGVEL